MLALLGFLAGGSCCGDDLAGRYETVDDWGTATLHLAADGTYLCEDRPSTCWGEVWSGSRGRWWRDHDGRLVLEVEAWIEHDRSEIRPVERGEDAPDMRVEVRDLEGLPLPGIAVKVDHVSELERVTDADGVVSFPKREIAEKSGDGDWMPGTLTVADERSEEAWSHSLSVEESGHDAFLFIKDLKAWSRTEKRRQVFHREKGGLVPVEEGVVPEELLPRFAYLRYVRTNTESPATSEASTLGDVLQVESGS
ncbi:MAG: hypothetical protein AAF533_29320 [Acidobacteriota bacterium]